MFQKPMPSPVSHSCYLVLVDQDAISQLLLQCYACLPVWMPMTMLNSRISMDSSCETASFQTSSFFYQLPWSLCLITTIEKWLRSLIATGAQMWSQQIHHWNITDIPVWACSVFHYSQYLWYRIYRNAYCQMNNENMVGIHIQSQTFLPHLDKKDREDGEMIQQLRTIDAL